MSKWQTSRLTEQHIAHGGASGIFSDDAQIHDKAVGRASKYVYEQLKKQYPDYKFRLRKDISKQEINNKLKSIDARLGETLFVKDSSIKPDGGVIEVQDRNSNWRVVLVTEAKFQGKDVENIQKGVLVGKNNDQELMVAGNAIERVYKNINEVRNFMLNELHFPYAVFLQGDKVKISWNGNESDGKIGTIVRKGCASSCVVKIPDIKGHDGYCNYNIPGNEDKWWVNEKHLIKLPEENQSMKIEVKQIKQTTKKPKEIVYPCFRRSNLGTYIVVLFFSEECGIAVKVSKSSKYFPGFIPKRRWIPSTFFETPLENYSATISSIP